MLFIYNIRKLIFLEQNILNSLLSLKKILSEDDILSAKNANSSARRIIRNQVVVSNNMLGSFTPNLVESSSKSMDFCIFLIQIGLKRGNHHRAQGIPMLISHLPWSFLLAKVVALSVQERIEGWIEGSEVMPESSWGHLQSRWVLTVFGFTPNFGEMIVFLAPETNKPQVLDMIC